MAKRPPVIIEGTYRVVESAGKRYQKDEELAGPFRWWGPFFAFVFLRVIWVLIARH